MDGMQPYVYRPTFGRLLVFATILLSVIAVVLVLVTEGPGPTVQVLPWVALFTGASWLLFYNPRVVVDDSGVLLVNVLRTLHLPWPSIQRVDTKWALTLVTSLGTYTAWAAPAPSRMSARRLSRRESEVLPESTYLGQDLIRPGDAPGSPSGDVALVIRRHYDALRDAGHLDDPRLEREKPRSAWHVIPVAVGAVLLVLGLVATL